MRDCSEQNEELASQLADTVCEFAVTIGDDFITAEDMPDTQPLTQAFDNALASLVSVPVAQQDAQQLFITFIKLSLFSIGVIHLCKKCQENASDNHIA